MLAIQINKATRIRVNLPIAETSSLSSSGVNKDTWTKAKAKDLHSKAKAKDLHSKAKAKALPSKAKAKAN